jgi:CPA2 family monovalent cation:H+ antiporter-2
VTRTCEHFDPDAMVAAPLTVCSVCVEEGTDWVHLRQCLTCGLTACCDESPRRHATAHARGTGHPMIRSAQPEEHWLWCYPDDRLYLADPRTEGNR